MYVADEDVCAEMFVPVRVDETVYGVPFLILKVDSACDASTTGCYYSLLKRGSLNVANKWTPDLEADGVQRLVPLRRTIMRANLIPVRVDWRQLTASGSKEGGYLAKQTINSMQEFLSTESVQ